MTVFVLKGSNETAYQVFGIFSTKEKAEENEKKLNTCGCIIRNKVKIEIEEIEVDSDSTVNFFYNE